MSTLNTEGSLSAADRAGMDAIEVFLANIPRQNHEPHGDYGAVIAAIESLDGQNISPDIARSIRLFITDSLMEKLGESNPMFNDPMVDFIESPGKHTFLDVLRSIEGCGHIKLVYDSKPAETCECIHTLEALGFKCGEEALIQLETLDDQSIGVSTLSRTVFVRAGNLSPRGYQYHADDMFYVKVMQSEATLTTEGHTVYQTWRPVIATCFNHTLSFKVQLTAWAGQTTYGPRKGSVKFSYQ